MIPNVVSWTHEPPRCMHSLSLKSCWIHNSSLQFPGSWSASLFFFLQGIAASIGTSNYFLAFMVVSLNSPSSRSMKEMPLSTFQHCQGLASSFSILVFLDSERLSRFCSILLAIHDLVWQLFELLSVSLCEQYTHRYSTYRVAQHDHIFITRTRVAQGLQSSELHIFVTLKQVSSTCHVSSFAAPDTDHKHRFSLTQFIHLSYLSDGLTFAQKPYDSRPIYTLRCSTAEWRNNTKPICRKLWAQVGWEQSLRHRSNRTWRPRAQKNWAWQESWGHIRTVDMDEFGKVGAEMSMTQRRALQTRILKMENYEKCWLHHGTCKVEKNVNPLECQSHRENLLHCHRREEQVQSVLELIIEKAWCQVRLRSRVHGETCWEAKNEKINSSVLFSKTLIRQIWEDLCLKGTKIICLVKQDLKLWSKNNKLNLSTIASDTQIRSMHGMGEIKWAQELRVDEVSVQKLTKIMRQCRNSLLSCKKCNKRWILWATQENFKEWN